MKIFVTGATGVIGRRAIPLLLSRGHAVTALARQNQDLPTEVHASLEGDAVLPPIDWAQWREVSRERHAAQPAAHPSQHADPPYAYSFVCYERAVG